QRKIRPRKNKEPKWRCNNGHEFENPKIIHEQAIEFIARYGNKYKEIKNIDISQLIEKTLKYNPQMSIQKINLLWATQLLKSQSTFDLNIEDRDADNDTPDFESEDKRKIILKQIRQRRGQCNFRNKLLDSHPVCAVTGCALVDILEAAHIDAYKNDTHNHISNGLLLRSDIHTLFDLNLCAINPNTNKVTFSKKVLKCGYQKLENTYLDIKHKISYDAISRRWIKFVK
ncbi:HNH endonuclease signature motif containing protein, partial [Morganella morganii subsp. sibonii]